jgi:hypothetical protein
MVSEDSSRRNDTIVGQVVSLRLAVGLLGERENAGWWASGFTSSTSVSFLSPIFGTKVLQSRYHGVLEAAKRVHDERIGVGRTFHLFRLPEAVERRLFDAVQLGDHDWGDTLSSSASATTVLERLAKKVSEPRPGPALVGGGAALDGNEWVADVASLYAAAFGAGVQCFPYFTGS